MDMVVEAQGSLFEVCGEKHQRERREASGTRGDTGGASLCSGPPGPPISTHPCPSRQPSSTQLLSDDDRPGVRATWSSARPHCPPLPSQRQASGLRDWPAWEGAGFPHGSCSTIILPISQNICPSTPQTHFWGPEMGPEPPSFSPAPILLICLSSDLPFL